MTKDAFNGTEIPLIPGELYGVRGFEVHEDGQLGPLHRDKELRYTSGVHVATCDDYETYTMQIGKNGTPFQLRSHNPWKSIIHRYDPIPSKDCQCGFYAYFDASEPNIYMPIYDGKHVNAIVRATGRCIVGSKGFRAEKMEIVGLVCDYPSIKYTTRLHRTMNEIIRGIANTGMGYVVGFSVVNFMMSILELVHKNKLTSFLANSTALIMYSVFIVLIAALAYTIWARKQDINTDAVMPKKDLARKIKEQYPDIEIFQSIQDAQVRFPLSKASDLPT